MFLYREHILAGNDGGLGRRHGGTVLVVARGLGGWSGGQVNGAVRGAVGGAIRPRAGLLSKNTWSCYQCLDVEFLYREHMLV